MNETGINFYGMQVRVARALGIAVPTASGAAPPSNVIDLELIKDALNDCIVTVMARHRFRWTMLHWSVTLSPDGTAPESIGNDPRLYSTPRNVRGFPSRATFQSPDGTWGDKLRCVNPNYVATRMARDGDVSGAPEIVAFEQAAGANATNPTWRLVVHPKPDAAYVARFVHRLKAWKLIDDVDCGPWPEAVALMLVTGAVSALAGGRLAPELNAGEWNARFERELAACMEQDKQDGPPVVESDDRPAWDASYAKVYENGVEIGS